MAEIQTLPAMVRAKYPGQYDDLSDADLDAKVRAKFPGVYDDIPKPSVKATAEAAQPSTKTGLALAAIGQAAPIARSAVASVVMNPIAPKTAATIGRVIGGVAPIVGGAVTGGAAAGPIGAVGGAMLGVAGAAKGAYVGGRTGWFTGKLLDEVATKAGIPLVNALDKIAPIARGISALGGAQGVNDLAQMAEPNRRDIGVMGVGPSAPRIDPDALLASQAATLDRLKVPAAQKAAALQRTKADLIRLGYYK